MNFDRVTDRLQPKNIWIGVHSLRGFDVHEGRFEHMPNEKQLEKEALSQTAGFKNNHKKDFDFTLKYYCKNGNY